MIAIEHDDGYNDDNDGDDKDEDHYYSHGDIDRTHCHQFSSHS